MTLNVVGKYVDTDKVDIGMPRYESECIPVIYNTKIAKNLKIEILDKYLMLIVFQMDLLLVMLRKTSGW